MLGARPRPPPGALLRLWHQPFAGRPLIGSLLFLLGFLGLSIRPLLLLIRHGALPSGHSPANMLLTPSDSTVEISAGVLPTVRPPLTVECGVADPPISPSRVVGLPAD